MAERYDDLRKAKSHVVELEARLDTLLGKARTLIDKLDEWDYSLSTLQVSDDEWSSLDELPSAANAVQQAYRDANALWTRGPEYSKGEPRPVDPEMPSPPAPGGKRRFEVSKERLVQPFTLQTSHFEDLCEAFENFGYGGKLECRIKFGSEVTDAEVLIRPDVIDHVRGTVYEDMGDVISADGKISLLRLVGTFPDGRYAVLFLNTRMTRLKECHHGHWNMDFEAYGPVKRVRCLQEKVATVMANARGGMWATLPGRVALHCANAVGRRYYFRIARFDLSPV